MLGEADLVNDSVQPVHSWKDSQITDGLLSFSRMAAAADTMAGGKAIIEAVLAQNFRSARREIPCNFNRSPRDILSLMCKLLTWKNSGFFLGKHEDTSV
jgi:hypothetical protein